MLLPDSIAMVQLAMVISLLRVRPNMLPSRDYVDRSLSSSHKDSVLNAEATPRLTTSRPPLLERWADLSREASVTALPCASLPEAEKDRQLRRISYAECRLSAATQTDRIL